MTDYSWPDTLEAFNQAAAWFVRITGDTEGRLADPALGEWTVRDLVGHTSRSLLTVESYLDQTQNTDGPISPVEYFRLALGTVTDPAAVAQGEAEVLDRRDRTVRGLRLVEVGLDRQQ